MSEPIYECSKMYTYLRGYVMGAGLVESQKALPYARIAHEGQSRNDGQPYLIHPLTMACHAAALGIKDDKLIATIFLHDVVEDCKIEIDELPVCEDVKKAVSFMTFRYEEGQNKEKEKELYYKRMIENKEATLCKLFDRCHNISCMAGVFTRDRQERYIDETKKYVLPLFKKAKDRYPEYSNVIYALKHHTIAVMEAILATMQK